jgi:hypothetical protein
VLMETALHHSPDLKREREKERERERETAY